MENFKILIDKLKAEKDLTDEEFLIILNENDENLSEYLKKNAREIREKIYGKNVYVRGLIEFTNFCKNNCYYCGIRRGNNNAIRYRLTEEEIIEIAKKGYGLGFRTIVLQGGEDAYFTDEKLEKIIKNIKKLFPEIAVTLSVGEREKESYKRLFDAGADRYLLRHETADKTHYNFLHPSEMSYEHRIKCLENLKEIGYQVGCGMMIGSPNQNVSHLLKDLRFLQKIKPQMVGIGPFIPHSDTIYKDKTIGSLKLTLKLLSIIRLMLPKVLLPATTALGAIHPEGRELGILAGANVVMPNITPKAAKEKYSLYDNKNRADNEASKYLKQISESLEKIGYKIMISRGDPAGM